MTSNYMSKLTKWFCHPIMIGIALFFSSLIYYGNTALNFPLLFNLDSHANHAATRYISKHQKIPVVTANDNEILFSSFGTSRLLRPPFTFAISALVSNLSSNWIEDRVQRQKLGSALIGAITIAVVFIGFWIAFQHTGLALLGAALIGLLPKFVFLATCNNDDIGAILSVSMLFTSVLALIRFKHNLWVLSALAISVGLIFQTKFTAWLVLPWLGLFSLILLKSIWSKLIKLTPILLLLCVASGGWWLILNMANYGVDDPTALGHASEIQRSLIDIEPNREGYSSQGINLSDLLSNHDQFLNKSFKSFIGYLEWVDLEVGLAAYSFYGLLFMFGIIAVAFRPRASQAVNHHLDLVIIILIVSQCAFYLHHNLLRDIQPQTRYVLPIIMPMVYLILRLIDELPKNSIVLKVKKREYGILNLASTVLIGACLLIHLTTMQRHIIPAYHQEPFNTRILDTTALPLRELIENSTVDSLIHRFIEKGIELERSGKDRPTLTLDPSICDYLPINALLKMQIEAPFEGGLHLRLDRNSQGSYENVYWHNVPAGSSTILFSINATECSGLRISLAKNTFQLTLKRIEVSELRIHQFGEPI